MGTNWPLVTVVIPTYRRPHLLPKAVQAVLDQHYPGPIECLVVFDREEPYRPEVSVPAHRELRCLSNVRQGAAGAYNTGILAASGEFVAICDDDDEWLPAKLRLQIEALSRDRDAAVAITGIYICNGRTHVRLPRKERLRPDDVLLAPRSVVHMSTIVASRKNVLDRIGLFDEAIPSSYGEDLDWFMRAAQVGPILAVRRALVRVNFRDSYYKERWQLILDALTYQLSRMPALVRHRPNLARMYGRMAFAYASLGRPAEARLWARRSIALNWRQPRGYLAFFVSLRLVRSETLVRMARAAGRGI
jgi:glycosyltransferase involved in cell wall biosynthesis